jgi:hypothetical protein
MAETGTRPTKLHELLAVEKNLEGQAHKMRTDLAKTFTDKRHLFAKKLVTYTANKVAEGPVPEPVVEEQSDIQTSVREEIGWLKPVMAKAFDASHQIDVANTIAKADIVDEDGTPLLTGVPATSLLRLEHRIQELHELINAIPTLDPAKGFTQDKAAGVGVYKARDVKKPRTKKEFRYVVMVPPTKEHPAQVKELNEDLPVGVMEQLEWSSLITPDTKAKLLNRCDQMARAVKKARARANEQEVDVKGNKIGETILNYVFSPISD